MPLNLPINRRAIKKPVTSDGLIEIVKFRSECDHPLVDQKITVSELNTLTVANLITAYGHVITAIVPFV